MPWTSRNSRNGGAVVSKEPYLERRYRGVVEPTGLTCFHLVKGESDLFICAEGDFKKTAKESLAACRAELEDYLATHLSFGTSFKPVPAASGAPDIVKEMAEAAEIFNVGPMASVAGAVAQHIGRELLSRSPEVIVENGGDLFLAGGGSRKVRVFAGGDSPSVDVMVEDRPEGVGLCTSSATVGPSASLGVADAVTVLAPTATLADAAATSIGNMIRSPDDIDAVMETASERDSIWGVLVIAGGSLGAWGRLEIVGP